MVTVLEDLSQNQDPSGRYENWERYNRLADAYQALGDYYASQGESALAAEYRGKAKEARTAVPAP
jgi:hypothetical protein